eukprot:scpid14495/ scgid35433/ 
MMLAINELKQVYQQQMESRSASAIATATDVTTTTAAAAAARWPSSRPASTTQQHHQQQHYTHIGGRQFMQHRLAERLAPLQPPHTSSSGTSGSGASISAPSSDCSNSEGSAGGVLQDYLKSSTGHMPFTSGNTIAPTGSGGGGGKPAEVHTVSLSHSGGGKSSFPVSQSTHW